MSAGRPILSGPLLVSLVWVVAFGVSLFFSRPGLASPSAGIVVLLGLGVPLTVLLAVGWSFFLPGRKLVIWLALACASWWFATALLVQHEWGWRLWFPLNTIALLAGAFSVGLWVAGEIEKSGHLIPVCVLGILVDIWSVFAGPSRHLGERVMEHEAQVAMTGVQTPPPLVSFLVLHWPMPGGNSMTGLFGVGDLVFVALLVGAARKFDLSAGKAFVLVTLGLLVASAVAMWLEKPVPALPFMCALFLAGNYGKMTLTSKEWAITAIAGLLVLVVIVSRYVGRLLVGTA